MKIIFSKQFLSELQQVEQVIKLNKFSVLPISGSISRDNLLNTSFATSKDLYSIWDNEKKLLSLSISFEDNDLNSLITSDGTGTLQNIYIQVFYNSSEVAFVLAGNVEKVDEDYFNLEGLNLSVLKNLINIDFSQILVASVIESNVTENIKILESPLDLGNNIYLVSPQNTDITITKKSYEKYYLSQKCSEEENTLLQDYLRSDTGERVYRNTVHRVYSEKQFFPKLVGDIVIIKSEGEPVVRTTTTTTTTTTDLPTGNTTTSTSSTTTKIPTNNNGNNKPDNSQKTTTTKSPTDNDTTKNPDIFYDNVEELNKVEDSNPRRSKISEFEFTTTTDIPSSSTTTTDMPELDDSCSDSEILEYNTLGLSYLGGTIKIVGFVGYNDYVIKNNKKQILNQGLYQFQNLNELSNLTVEIKPLIDEKTGKYFPEIDLKVSDKQIIYGSSSNPEITKGNTIEISLSTLDDNGNVTYCKKTFKLKQSNDYDSPWEIRIPNNVEIGYEYESQKTGLSLKPVPVIIFESDGKTLDGNDCILEVITTDTEVVHKSFVNGVYKLTFGFAEGYDNSYALVGSSYIYETADVIFNRFFSITYLGFIEEGNKNKIYKHRFSITTNTEKNQTEMYYPNNLWVPYSNYKEGGNHQQLLVKCRITLNFEGGVETLHGKNSFVTPFYVVQKPNYRKQIYSYDGSVNIAEKDWEDKLISKGISLTQDNHYNKNIRLSGNVGRMSNTAEDLGNAWILVNPNSVEDLSIKVLGNETDNGYFSLDTSTYSREYSDIINISSTGNNLNIEPITFNYIDCYLFGKNYVQNVIDDFDYTDWKSTILMQKLTLPISKDKFIKYSFDSIILNKDGNSIKFEKKKITESSSEYLGISEVGVTPITLNSNCKIKVELINFWKNDDDDVKKYVFLGGINQSGKLEVNETDKIFLNVINSQLKYTNENGFSKICDLKIETVSGGSEKSVTIPVYSFFDRSGYFSFTNTNISNGLIRGYELLKNSNGILNNIFLTGYKYLPDKKAAIELKENDLISIEFTSPLNAVALGTNFNKSGLEFDERTVSVKYNNEDYINLGSSIANISNDFIYSHHTVSFNCKSETPGEDLGSKKYPISESIGKLLIDTKLGELGTSVHGFPVEYNLYKKGLKPDIYNSYNEKELPRNLRINVSSTDTNFNFSLDLQTLYPLKPNDTLTIGTTTGIKNFSYKLTPDSEKGEDYINNDLLGYNMDAEIELYPRKIGDQLKEGDKITTVILQHFLGKNRLFDDSIKPEEEEFSKYSEDEIRNLIGIFETNLDIYYVGTEYNEFFPNTTNISIYGETRNYEISKAANLKSQLIFESEENILKNSFPSEKLTDKNSIIEFSIDYPAFEKVINYYNNYSDNKIDLTINNSDTLRQLTETRNFNYKINILSEKDVIIKEYDVNTVQNGIENGIFFKDDSFCYLYIKDSVKDSGLEKTISSDSTSIKFNALQVKLADFVNFSDKNYTITGKSVDIETGLGSNDITYELVELESLNNFTAYNVIINIPPNFTNEEVVREFFIVNDDGKKIKYKVIQQAYSPKIYINNIDLNGLTPETNCILGFHSSGNLLDNNDEESNFGYMTIKTNTSGIYNLETGQINLDADPEIGLEHFVTDIRVDNQGNFTYKVAISISPNYIRGNTIEGEITLYDNNRNEWKVGFRQGYITSNLLLTGTYEDNTSDGFGLIKVDKEDFGYSTMGFVGTEEEPILYPATNVKFEPYFYVQILQKEVEFKNGLVVWGSETLISNSNNTIPKTLKSMAQDYYTVVTYEADPWTTNVKDGLDLVFKPGSYDTDLLYKYDSDFYPRLIHRYNISDDFGGNELLFNVIVRLSINRYKKYLYKVADDTNNIITEVQSFDTTPFVYSFWLKKTKTDNNIPIKLCDSNKEEVKQINFLGFVDESKIVYIESEYPGFDLKDVEITSSDNWLKVEPYYNKANEYVLITTDVNTTGKTRNGVITFIPYDTITWNGVRSIDVYQDCPKVTYNKSSKTLKIPSSVQEDIQKLTLPFYISSGTKVISRVYSITLTDGTECTWFSPYIEEGSSSNIIIKDSNNESWVFKSEENTDREDRQCIVFIKIEYEFGQVKSTYEDEIVIIQRGASATTTTTTTTTSTTSSPSTESPSGTDES